MYEWILQCYLHQWKPNLKEWGNIVWFCLRAFILNLKGNKFLCFFLFVHFRLCLKLLSPLLEIQTVGQTPLLLFSHLIYSLNKAGQIDGEVSKWDWIFGFDTELDCSWHCIKANYNNRIHSGYNSIYNLYVFL